jgi:hypothetical protein
VIKRVLLVLVLLIVGALVAVDLVAKNVAEGELAERVRMEVPEVDASSARIRSFPFLARLLTSGRVSQVEAEANGVTVRGLRFAAIEVTLEGATFDRDLLVRDRRVVLERIDRGTVRAEVGEGDLSHALGVPIRLRDGRASVTVSGREYSAQLEVRQNRLVVAGVNLDLPEIDLLAPLMPCVGDAQVQTGRIVLSCEFTEVPQEFLDRAQAQI